MRRHVAVLLPCLLAVVACGAFGADAPVDADAGTDATPDGAQTDAAPPSDGGACAHLRCLTFEEGLLGFDDKAGAPTLATTDAPKGNRALSVGRPGTTYIVVETGMRAELWLSFYVRLRKLTGDDAAPFSVLAANGTALATGAFNGATLSVPRRCGSARETWCSSSPKPRT